MLHHSSISPWLNAVCVASLLYPLPSDVLHAQVLGAAACQSQPRAQGWTLVWSDEFDGTSVDTSNWTYDTGGGGWGNNELENYTGRTDNAAVAEGSLLIIAKKETMGSNAYTSARLKTQGLRNFRYGRIEARMKLPAGQGLWPAFWLLGQDITTVGWPACGEIDIMEHINKVPLCYGTMHWNNNGHVSYGSSTGCDVSQYHVYAVEWDSTAITWLVDTVRYCTGNIANNINGIGAFHAPFFILLNLAVGGQWPGSPDGTTSFPDTMFVDYVRVYQPNVTGVPEQGSNVPEHLMLLQNFPNPFNPSTTIQYALPRRSHVTISVFDTLGRIVSTLVDGEEQAGYHAAIFDGTGLASGMYFYRLQAGSFVKTMKSLLLK